MTYTQHHHDAHGHVPGAAPPPLIPTAREPMLAFPSLSLCAAEYLWRPASGLPAGLEMVRSTQLSGVLTCAMAYQALAGTDPVVTVNVDADQLGPELAAALVATCGRQSHRLLLGVTETTVLDPDWSRAASICARAGIGLVVDDAGTGYADVERIAQLRPRMVKLDRSLLAPLADGLARRLVTAARAIGALVVAEGVEDLHGLARAHELHANLIQGYLVNRLERNPAECAPTRTASRPTPVEVGVSAVPAAASSG